MHKITIEIPSNGFCNKCPFMREEQGFGQEEFYCIRFTDKHGNWTRLDEHQYEDPKPLPCRECENKTTMKGWLETGILYPKGKDNG